jgi:hypothetical protein
LSNQFTSSLNLSTNANGFFFFDAALYYNQNTRNKTIGISLPEMNMSVRQFYPFRKKFRSGKLRWYDNISLKWTSQMANKINTIDTLFFKPETWQEIQSGITHNIPLTVPIKIGKNFNWNTNASLNEKWYMQRNQQQFTEISDSTKKPEIFFERGFYALHDFSLSTSLTTKIFFNYSLIKDRWLKATRHVMSPTLDFTYRPNLSGNTYGTYFNTITGREVQYSYFEGAMYGLVANRMQAITRLSINNNLEIKVRSKKDSIIGTRKITLFDNVNVSCGYDFAADSLNWLPLTISGRTSFFSFLDVTFRLRFDPYIINNQGRNLNQTELQVNKRLMRFSESDLNIGINWRLNQDFFKGKKKKEEPEPAPGITPPDNLLGMPKRPDFTNPWNITINYTFAFLTRDNKYYYEQYTGKKYTNNIIQTINIMGDVSITRKWKISFLTGYDIQQKDFSYTKIEIYRDLHCWEMSFYWVPFGYRKEWGFKINVKASVLQDLKYDMRRDFRDNVY